MGRLSARTALRAPADAGSRVREDGAHGALTHGRRGRKPPGPEGGAGRREPRGLELPAPSRRPSPRRQPRPPSARRGLRSGKADPAAGPSAAEPRSPGAGPGLTAPPASRSRSPRGDTRPCPGAAWRCGRGGGDRSGPGQAPGGDGAEGWAASSPQTAPRTRTRTLPAGSVEGGRTGEGKEPCALCMFRRPEPPRSQPSSPTP